MRPGMSNFMLIVLVSTHPYRVLNWLMEARGNRTWQKLLHLMKNRDGR